jgi:hypothetical protein
MQPRWKTGRRPATLAVVLVLASLAVAACGESSATSTPTDTASANATTATTSPATTATSPATTATTPTKTGTSPTTTSGAPGPTATNPSTTPQSSGSGKATSPGTTARINAVRACLAGYGIKFPKTAAPAKPGSLFGNPPPGVSVSRYQAALRACIGNLLPTIKEIQSRYIQALKNYTACMREHGINLPEPNTSGRGPLIDTKGVNTHSSQFQAANQTCRTKLRVTAAR